MDNDKKFMVIYQNYEYNILKIKKIIYLSKNPIIRYGDHGKKIIYMCLCKILKRV